MKKAFLCIIVCLVTLAILFCIANAAGTIEESSFSVVLNGHQIEFDSSPIMVNDRTLVPMRIIFEKLGATVSWDESTQTVSASKGDKKVTLQIDNDVAYANGSPVKLDAPPMLYNGRTMVPLRFLSEQFGLKVDYDERYSKIWISDETSAKAESSQSKNKTIPIGDTGMTYIGEAVNDTPQGYGVVYQKNGKKLFEGNFVNGELTGKGIRYNEQGVKIYEGEFSGYLYNGKGELFNEDGSVLAAGEFVNGQLVNKYIPVEDIPSYVNEQTNKNTGSNNSSGNYSVAYPLYLYADDNKVTYLGKLDLNQNDSESVFNSNSTYGSKYNSNSIFNEYGTYGSQYSQYSAFNKTALHPPKIVDNNGEIVGYLTVNEQIDGGVTLEEVKTILNSSISSNTSSNNSKYDNASTDSDSYEEELETINDKYDASIDALKEAKKEATDSIMSMAGPNSASITAAAQSAQRIEADYDAKISEQEAKRDTEIEKLKRKYGE